MKPYKIRFNAFLFIGIMILLIMILLSVIIPLINSNSWTETNGLSRFKAPSLEHPFGTTELGKDLFLGVWLGGRLSLMMISTAVLPYVILGTVFGVVAGSYSKKIDVIISQIMMFLYAIPSIPFIMLFGFVIKTFGLTNHQRVFTSMLLYSVLSAPLLFKVIRTETLKLQSLEFMNAARLLGIHRVQLLKNHLLPNLIGHISVSTVHFMSQLLIIELVLYYFGVYISPIELPTWGSLIPNLQGPNTFKEYYWIWLFPILAVALTSIGLKFLSEGLRIKLDHRND